MAGLECKDYNAITWKKWNKMVLFCKYNCDYGKYINLRFYNLVFSLKFLAAPIWLTFSKTSKCFWRWIFVFLGMRSQEWTNFVLILTQNLYRVRKSQPELCDLRLDKQVQLFIYYYLLPFLIQLHEGLQPATFSKKRPRHRSFFCLIN